MSGPLIVDYPSLQTAIAEWLWRVGDGNIVNRAPDFINFFESDFARDRRLRKMEEQDTTTVTSAVIPLPAGYLEMVDIQSLGGGGAPAQPLTYVTPNYANILDANAAATPIGTGIVKNYTIRANNLVLVPQIWFPAGATVAMSYYSFTKLSVAAPTNWLITDYPNLYLYGSLLHASAYVDDDGAIAKWKAGHDEAMEKLLLSDNKARLGAGPLQMRPSASFQR